jgi:hypothetical protein
VTVHRSYDDFKEKWVNIYFAGRLIHSKVKGGNRGENRDCLTWLARGENRDCLRACRSELSALRLQNPIDRAIS